MPGGAGSLVIQTALHTTNWWILIPLDVGRHAFIDVVLDTGSPMSAISVRTHQRLQRSGDLIPIPNAQNRFTLRSLPIQGQPIADLQVRISGRVTLVGADGVLGLDFLTQFREIHFDVPALWLTLTP